jgi:hypothetical protein
MSDEFDWDFGSNGAEQRVPNRGILGRRVRALRLGIEHELT